jgi:hypothetical protein
LGCRIFFCDATRDDWQHERYERFHGDLKRLHEELGVPYLYVEWREALRALGEIVLPERANGAAGVRETASGRTGNASAKMGKLSLPQRPF